MADQKNDLDPLMNSIEAVLKAFDNHEVPEQTLVDDVRREFDAIMVAGCKGASYVPNPKSDQA